MNRKSKNTRRLIADKDIERITDYLPEVEAKEAKRQVRKSLLSALDIYDKNVSKGRITETQDEKIIVDRWYNAILDLEEWAFNDIPAKVKRYML